MARIIVNADDFGLDERTNLAIVHAYRNRLISHTTLLANMEGFEHALQLISDSQIDKKDIGIHINLTQGKPLTEGISKDTFFCSNGIFHGNIRKKPILYLNKHRRRLVINEIAAQIGMLKNNGLEIRHLDGHHHIHTEWAIFRAIAKTIKSNGIRSIRISRTEFVIEYSFRKLLVKIYKLMFNFYIRNQGFITTNRMGELFDYKKINLNSTYSIEIMTHLVTNHNGASFDGIEYAAFSKKLNNLLTNNFIGSFEDLK